MNNQQEEPLYLIDINGSQLTLLGTAHVSKASADKVNELLSSEDYDAVAVELCPSRYNALINPDSLAKMDIFDVIRQGKGMMVIANLALGAYQQRMADELGIEPGSEMRVAVNLAKEKNLPVLLIDREIGTTLKRIYRNLSFFRRMNLITALFASVITREKVSEEEIEKLKEGDVLETAFSQFATKERDLFKPLIDERDLYMSLRLQAESTDNDYPRILAIVGAGHLKGMRQYLAQSYESIPDEIKKLDHEPPPSKWPKVFPWVIVIVIFIGFGIGFSKSPDFGWLLVTQWVVINGGLAALGALIARAHPLTVIGAFLAAPLTSLNPTIGAGMVTAAIETFLRKPEVGDFMQLRADTAKLSGWWNNKVARIFLIFLFSTLGSAIGTYVAGFMIFEQIFGS